MPNIPRMKLKMTVIKIIYNHLRLVKFITYYSEMYN